METQLITVATLHLLTVIILTSLLARSLDAQAIRMDICRKNKTCSTCAALPPIVSSSFSDYCSESPLAVVGDGGARLYFHAGSNQCRVLCVSFAIQEYRSIILPSNCTFCQTKVAYNNFATLSYASNFVSYPHYCIPRTICISQCGPELPGCIYSGSCASQLCFEGNTSGKKATRQLITVKGPGTVFKVDDTPGKNVNGTLISTYPGFPSDIPQSIAYGEDYCSSRGLLLNTARDCFTTRKPITDALTTSSQVDAQCRIMCFNYNRRTYGVLRRPVDCNLCNQPESDKYVMTGLKNTTICIPREKCAKSCGKEPDGCVYTGSCRSMICLFGLRTKNAANLTVTNDGESSTISVDDTGPLKDDPAFLQNALPSLSPTPSKNSAPSPSRFPAPNSSINPVLSSTPVPTRPTTDDSTINKGNGRIVWLGPLLGILLLIALLILLYYVCVVRGRNKVEPETAVAI